MLPVRLSKKSIWNHKEERMKKIFSIVLALILLVSPVTGAKAAERNEELLCETVNVVNPHTGEEESVIAEAVIHLPDGSRIIKTAIEKESLTRARGDITGTNQHLKIGSDGTLQWRVTLRAHFTFDGSSSKCIWATSTTEVFQGNWSESSNNTFPNGSTAVANVTVVRKFLFVTVETHYVTLTIHCDRNGNLS